MVVGGTGVASRGNGWFGGGGDLRARENLCRAWDADAEEEEVEEEEDEFKQVDAKARSHTPISARP